MAFLVKECRDLVMQSIKELTMLFFEAKEILIASLKLC